jgi:L-rhamnose mutarotase
MERVGHLWRVKPGMADEYRRRHATVWPELERLLRDAGVRQYSIYLSGELVVSHMEVESFERLVQAFNGDPIAQRWEAMFSDLIDYPDADPDTGWPSRMVEVWSL